jgi:hypothetical protein
MLAPVDPRCAEHAGARWHRTPDITGREDHSILIRGVGNVATYDDDSNVWIARNGKINGNTGDTGDAGLNAVDTVRSTVSTSPQARWPAGHPAIRAPKPRTSCNRQQGADGGMTAKSSETPRRPLTRANRAPPTGFEPVSPP